MVKPDQLTGPREDSARGRAGSYIMIAGPTASGKSQLALELAAAVDGEIINADSMQLYGDLSVLTARPTAADLAAAPHHLYGILDAKFRASVAAWLDLAATAKADIESRAKMPIIIGGTGMYLQAAINGIAPVPEVPAAIHQSCISWYDKIGGAAFRQELARLDPVIAGRLADGDRQRLIRAMGVAKASDTPLSRWQAAPHHGALPGVAVTIAKLPSRDALYQRIDSRFDKMIAAGAVDEVRDLAKRSLDPGLPLMKALGVKPLMAVVSGDMTLGEAAYLTKRDSRHYAKRQMTWLRNNFHANLTVDKKLSESILHNIFSFIR